MMDFPRTYAVRTLGCQMNEHDSERISGLLEKAGLVPVAYPPQLREQQMRETWARTLSSLTPAPFVKMPPHGFSAILDN